MKNENEAQKIKNTGEEIEINKIKLIRPSELMIAKINHYIKEYRLQSSKREINYHFNIDNWRVNLADTKRSMINYDFHDLVNGFHAKCYKEDNETQKEFQQREREETEKLRNDFLNLYYEFRHYVVEQLKPIVTKMNYEDLFQLFNYTWGNAPFKLNYLLEDMFLLLGDQSIMQNVVGNSGSFKSTRSMIEFNSLPSVLLIDDATVAGISRDCQTKGNDYLDNTVVYYNDVGDSAQMQNNFKDCLQSVYKKLFSEGAINRTLAMKNSDKTLRLDLKTPHGFKLKFNSVKPIFNEDDGQTASRTMIINLPSFTPEESEELIRSGRFGEAVYSEIDPRIFKDVLQVYYKTRNFEGFSNEYKSELGRRCIKDNDNESNFHLIGNMFYKHKEMCKLYGTEFYKDKYYNRVMINTSMADLESELYEVIQEGLNIKPIDFSELQTINNLNEFRVAKTKTASAHKGEHNYDSFTVKAVKGIRRNFIKNNSTQISFLLKSMEEHDLCEKVGTLNNYNVYVLLKK